MTVLKSIKLIRLVRSITQRPTIHLDFKAISSHFSSSCSAAMAPIRDNKEEGRMLWVDLEMTGLDAETDRILEIACLITEKDLSIVAEGPDLVIHQSDAVLEGMDEWCVQHHGKSGLTAASKNSKIDTKEAEKMVLEFVKQHTSKGNCLIAGNSVGMDKRFIDKYMPQLSEHLHYRVVDVSTIKELCRRWYPNNYHTAPSKKCTHRAMDDIRESIEELRYYRNSIFK